MTGLGDFGDGSIAILGDDLTIDDDARPLPAAERPRRGVLRLLQGAASCASSAARTAPRGATSARDVRRVRLARLGSGSGRAAAAASSRGSSPSRSMHPAFPRSPPFAPVVVEMDEGVRLVSEIVDCPPDELAIGMPVEVVCDDVTDEVTLPRFRRLGVTARRIFLDLNGDTRP